MSAKRGLTLSASSGKRPKALLVIKPLELADDDDIRVKTAQTSKLGLHAIQATLKPCGIGHRFGNVDFASVVRVGLALGHCVSLLRGSPSVPAKQHVFVVPKPKRLGNHSLFGRELAGALQNLEDSLSA